VLLLNLLIPKSWTGFQPGNQPPAMAVEFLTILLFASWNCIDHALGFTRRLGRTKQFWTTRPYVVDELLLLEKSHLRSDLRLMRPMLLSRCTF